MNITDIKPGQFLIRRNGQSGTVNRRLEGTILIQDTVPPQIERSWGYYGTKIRGANSVWPDKDAPIVWALWGVQDRTEEDFGKDIVAVFEGPYPNSKLVWKANTEKFKKEKRS